MDKEKLRSAKNHIWLLLAGYEIIIFLIYGFITTGIIGGMAGAAVAWTIGWKMNILINIHKMFKKRNLEFMTFITMCALGLKFGILGLSMIVGGLTYGVITQNNTISNDIHVQRAERLVVQSQKNLEKAQKSNPNTQAEMDSALATLEVLFEDRTQAIKSEAAKNATALSTWLTFQDTWWNKPDSYSKIKRNEVMHDDCSFKTYNGGIMRTASERLCPQWRAVQKQHRPVTQKTQEIISIEEKLLKTKKITNWQRKLDKLAENVITALGNEATARENAVGGEIVYNDGLHMLTHFLTDYMPNITTSKLYTVWVSAIVMMLILSGIIVLIAMNEYEDNPDYIVKDLTSVVTPDGWATYLWKKLIGLAYKRTGYIPKDDTNKQQDLVVVNKSVQPVNTDVTDDMIGELVKDIEDKKVTIFSYKALGKWAKKKGENWTQKTIDEVRLKLIELGLAVKNVRGSTLSPA